MNAIQLLKADHRKMRTLLDELEALPVDDETWGAKALVMKENVEHHMEEEEGDMFTKAEQVFDAAELDDLGRRMTERKESAAAEIGLAIRA